MSKTFDYGPPTSVPHVLDALLGATITRLTRYSNEACDVLVNASDFKDFLALSSRDAFAYTDGPLLIELNSGVRVGANGDSTESGSVILWIERDAQGNEPPADSRVRDSDFHLIASCDPIYSDPESCAIVGRTIRSAIVLKGPQNVSRPRWPCEVAVRLLVDSGDELALCYGLHGGMDIDFSVRTKSRIPPGYFETLTEVYRR